MKNPFNKTAIKSAAIKATCNTLGTAHFILQGAADLVKEAEGVIVHKIDGNIGYNDVKEVRDNLYAKNASRVKIAYYNSLLKLEEAKDKLADSIESMKQRIDPVLTIVPNEEAVENAEVCATS